MNRPVVPLVYAATARPLLSTTRWTDGLEPTPAAHNVDVMSLRSASSYVTRLVESDAKKTVSPAALGSGEADGGGVAS